MNCNCAGKVGFAPETIFSHPSLHISQEHSGRTPKAESVGQELRESRRKQNIRDLEA